MTSLLLASGLVSMICVLAGYWLMDEGRLT